MYPSWQSPEDSSPVHSYWTQHVAPTVASAAAAGVTSNVAHHKVAAAAAAAYDPLLYPQNYMNNMKNMLGAAAQWVESSSA
ncbi:unnamed protein product [Anisakis simplex]|uniref:Homeobox protein knotted-1-like 3 n=1 Tax=Anisakis simplex TaxID=6269 RepID=A0A0M3K6Y9_ANISI|nr:unnamed protein product [Anisakis simplex]